uniref:Uncharacterized protein n=1 Tax=Knipowitschia caucasica TaxID=637954 RepID=A0AAV2J481_KNICA
MSCSRHPSTFPAHCRAAQQGFDLYPKICAPGERLYNELPQSLFQQGGLTSHYKYSSQCGLPAELSPRA